MPNFLLGFLTNNKKGENEMKKNLMFFALGVSTTLLMGAGISYWNEIRQENKYGVEVNPPIFDYNIPRENKYGVQVNPPIFDPNITSENKYGVQVNPPIFDPNIPRENRYALIVDGNVSQNAKNVMVAGFIHGMAVGRKKAKEEAAPRNQNYQRTNYGYGF